MSFRLLTEILTYAVVIIECISWLIKVTDTNDERWKPENETRRINIVTILTYFHSTFGQTRINYKHRPIRGRF